MLMLVEINETSCKTYYTTGQDANRESHFVEFALKLFVTGLAFVLKFFVGGMDSIVIYRKSRDGLFPVSFQK